ncbi:MAG: molybdopterin molybdotransferase MoeA [Phycisphaerales bacterium]
MPPLPDYPEALARVLDALPTAIPARRRAVEFCLGATLAAPILADRDQPPFDRAEMDGYAVRAADIREGARLRIVGETPAGAGPGPSIKQGECVRIATGAPLPPDADAVIPHEQTDRGHPVVTIHAEAAVPGQSVHRQGADARAVDTIVPAGTRLAPHHPAIASAVGATTLEIRGGPPSLTLLTSGDEIVDAATPTDALRPEQIRDAALPLLRGFASAVGAPVLAAHRLSDDRDATRRAVERAAASSDLVVTVGGVSAGERDFFPGAFDAIGCDTLLRGAAVRPGRPILVALRREPFCICIGLPGNPVSALATAHLFLWPIVRHLAGLGAALPWREHELAESVAPSALRRTFRPAILEADGRVRAPAWRGSGDLAHTAPTNGLIDLAPGAAPINDGARVRFLPWAWEAQQ